MKITSEAAIAGARSALKTGKSDRARKLIADALLRDPDHPELLWRAAYFEHHAGNDERALALILEAEKHGNTSPEGLKLAALVLDRQQQWAELKQVLAQRCQRQHDDVELRKLAAGLYVSTLGDFEAAAGLLRGLADLGSRELLLLVLAKLDAREELIGLAKSMIDGGQASALARYYLAETLLSRGQIAEARDVAVTLASETNENPMFAALLGRVYEASGNPVEAERYVRLQHDCLERAGQRRQQSADAGDKPTQ